MLGRLTQFLRTRSKARKLEHYAIPDALWAQTVSTLPFVQRYGSDDLTALRELATLFIAEKEYSTAHDLPLTDDMVVSVAVQACVPILRANSSSAARSRMKSGWFMAWSRKPAARPGNTVRSFCPGPT
jgi:Mlc titration factor MtfA (ptsG expression regulator)